MKDGKRDKLQDPLLLENQKYYSAILSIKSAILQSRLKAALFSNKELLALYFGIGEYVSQNSRTNFLGKGAINYISKQLQIELPGLRGFSPSNIKNMRTFYEEWSSIVFKSPTTTNDNQNSENDGIVIRQLQLANLILHI